LTPLPLARTGELLTELLGAPVSQGSLAGWYTAAADATEPALAAVTAGLAAAEVLGADETGIRVAGGLATVGTDAHYGNWFEPSEVPNRSII